MKCPWWIKSTTVQCGVVAIAIAAIPAVRREIHQASTIVVALQSLLHIALRFKTEKRPLKLSDPRVIEWTPKEEG